MDLIETLPELIKNTLFLEEKLNSENSSDWKIASNLLKDGICFVKYIHQDKVYFAPSRFIGYANNTLQKQIDNGEKHGSTTNNRIKRILNQIAQPNKKLEQEYFRFCSAYGIQPSKNVKFNLIRKFWDLSNLEPNVYGEIELPEGKKRMATHIIRERNPRLRQQAINNFLATNKTLHCEACKFNFEKKYGKHGKDFIECHHTIPLSQMKHGHKTKSEDLVLLCSNCHRMVHRGKKWLSLDELRKLMKK